VNTLIVAEASFGDPGFLDTHTATWDWGDGTIEAGTVTGSNGAGFVTGSHAYLSAGLYTVSLTVIDDEGESASAASTSVVVYDPDVGFVTGGDWIDSPEGTYTPDPTLTGRATFGFVSKYRKGAEIPTGNTQFQLRAADLTFHSSGYEWLVVDRGGHRAQFKGDGTVNGTGGFKFMIWASDGDPDRFRIKIWQEPEEGIEVAIYDNGFDQMIGGGSIVIHAK
jgi:hypothetical protein